MAVGEDVGFDDDAISDNSLDRELAAVDFRANSLDDHSALHVDLPMQTRLL